MRQRLIPSLVPRLKQLEKGGYERGYRLGQSGWGSQTGQLIGGLLDAIGVRYRSNVPVPGTASLTADFVVNGTWVFIGNLSRSDKSRLSKAGVRFVTLTIDKLRSDRFDFGLRIAGVEEAAGLQTIFLDDPSFNFDYAHILPKTQKCSVMHGHTSSVLVEVVGSPKDGMVVDFADAKRIVKEAVGGLDHKLFIDKRYVTGGDARSVSLTFETVHGEFSIKAPKQTTVLLGGEATVENLAKEVLSRIAPKMPDNVSAVGVYVYEGLNKGSHILARLHEEGAEKRPRKR